MNDEIDRTQEALDEHKCFEGVGWRPLIADLELKLRALVPDYKVSQVKEKFGGLRYYANPGNVDEETSNQFYALIRAAEAKADVTCECCGRPGRLTQRGEGGWYKTLCARCSRNLNFEPVDDDDASATS
jgi:hypothetical protein